MTLSEKRKISAFEKECSYDEYIKICVVMNNGTQSRVMKSDLVTLCNKQNVTYDKKDTKEELYDRLLQSGYTPQEAEKEFGLGVVSKAYQEAFNLTHSDVKRLEKRGFLKVVGKYRARAYGKTIYTPLYSAWQFVTINDIDVLTQYEKI